MSVVAAVGGASRGSNRFGEATQSTVSSCQALSPAARGLELAFRHELLKGQLAAGGERLALLAALRWWVEAAGTGVDVTARCGAARQGSDWEPRTAYGVRHTAWGGCWACMWTSCRDLKLQVGACGLWM